MQIKKNRLYILDFLIPFVAILFTLLIENKLNSIDIVKEHPVNFIIAFVVISLVLVGLKIKFELEEKDLENEILTLKTNIESITEENNFFKALISSFKYQISQPLEDKLYEVYNALKFDNHYRITVYTYTKDRFFSIGRYSKNSLYKQFGRIAIKNKNELIFRAWYNGELKETIKVDKSRKMPSEKIVIRYLYENNTQNPDKDKFGVVVFETTQKNTKKFNVEDLNKAVKSINIFLNESMGLRQDLNFAIAEEL